MFHTKRKEIISALAAADPANAVWQRDLSVALDKLGDLAIAQGDLLAAARYFTEYNTIAACLAAADPANAAWQRDLSVALNKLGDLAAAQGDIPAAARHFTESNAVLARLASADPTNAAWQRDLSVSHYKLYEFAQATGDEAMAHAELRACFSVLDAMKCRNLHFDPQMARVYEALSGMLAGAGTLARTSQFPPEVSAPSPAPFSPPAPPRDPVLVALSLLKAGKAREALDKLRPILFPGETVDMDHRKPLLARLAFLHALWMTGNVDGVIRHLTYIPEQDDPRVQNIVRTLAEWRQGFSMAQKLGIRSKPPLPPLPPLDDETL